jgi:hypothetical protein
MGTVWPQINGSGIPQLKVLLLSFQVFAAKYIGLVMSADREFLAGKYCSCRKNTVEDERLG